MQPDAVRVPSAVPAWSMLAVARARAARPRSGWARYERLASVTLVPFSLGFACMLMAAMSIVSWPVALAVALVGSVVAAKLRGSFVGRSWRERNEQAARECAAVQLKRELQARLPADQREELARLELLVEHVRAQPGPFGQDGGGSPLVTRLDGLIVTYVDLALELGRSIAAFAATADDVPATDERAAELDGTRARYGRIAQLRTQARELCRRRIARLRADLGGVGQLIRLVHEQTLAAGIASDEVARTLGEVLDEAELARQAREELEGVLPRRTQPAMPPFGGELPRALPCAS